MVGFRRAGSSGVVASLLLFSLVFLAPWLTACGGSSSSDPQREVADPAQAGGSEASDLDPPELPQLLRGHLVLGHEVRSFRLCGSEQDLWVTDETDGELARIYEELTSAVYQELYTVVSGEIGPPPSDGFGADYAGSIRVAALSHAAPESHACDEDLKGIKIRASGNEPFWRLDIREEEILLSELGLEDRLFYSAPSSVQSGGPRHFRGAAETAAGAAAGASIEIVIEERACRDSMLGAYFSFSAHVQVDGRELDGCARQGW